MQRNGRFFRICFILLATILFTGCGDKKEHREKSPEKPVHQTETVEKSTFLLKDGNRTVTVKSTDNGFEFDVEEPLVMLDFFATWCPPCRAEIPHLANLQKRYAGKLKIVGVLLEKKHPAELARFVSGHGINYFVSNTPDNMLLASKTADMLHQPKNFSIPMTVLFLEGRYFRHYIGMVPEEMLANDIEEALKEVE
ncbi:thioredoxin domain-containing protein [Hydrogenimonas sp.]